MSLEVLILDEHADEWDELLAAMPVRQQDVYFGSAYLLLWQRNGDGRAHGAVFRHGKTRVLYPFLLRSLREVPTLGDEWTDYADIQTPYGYGGPLISRGSGDEHGIRLFRQAFGEWCREHNVISEFVRFHPLLDTHLGLDPYLDVRRANTTVWCRTDCTTGERLQNLSSSTRRGVRKARKSGLELRVESDPAAYHEFARLYRATMERLEAQPYYLFGDDYFDDIRELLGPAQSLLTVRHDGKLAAGALFIRSQPFIHYHLGGSDPELLPLRPNNLLFFEAMTWGCSRGQVAMHLGGGYQAGDELFRFKSGFSPLRASFYIGRAVHNDEAYEWACAARERPGTQPAAAGYFPAYRAPLPRAGQDVEESAGHSAT
jgi:hypothetical protein